MIQSVDGFTYIQFNLAPSTRTTSAFFSAVDRAEAVLQGWESAMIPFPIGVARKGICVLSMSSRKTVSALAYALPLPMTTSGEEADVSSAAILGTLPTSGNTTPGGGGWTGRAEAAGAAQAVCRKSPGRSTKPVPERPYHAA